MSLQNSYSNAHHITRRSGLGAYYNATPLSAESRKEVTTVRPYTVLAAGLFSWGHPPAKPDCRFAA